MYIYVCPTSGITIVPSLYSRHSSVSCRTPACLHGRVRNFPRCTQSLPLHSDRRLWRTDLCRSQSSPGCYPRTGWTKLNSQKKRERWQHCQQEIRLPEMQISSMPSCWRHSKWKLNGNSRAATYVIASSSSIQIKHCNTNMYSKN